MSAFANTNVIVIDANVSLAQVLPLSYSPQARAQMQSWEKERARIIVPALWEYEVVSGQRRACVNKIMNSESARQALQFMFDMRFETIPGTPERHQRALEWAERFGQARAYDARYLALADELGTALWTGDLRLANGASQLAISWVHWIGEE